MKTGTLGSSLRTTQLAVCGAIIGLHAAKFFGLTGFEQVEQLETIGASLGVGGVLLLKAFNAL